MRARREARRIAACRRAREIAVTGDGLSSEAAEGQAESIDGEAGEEDTPGCPTPAHDRHSALAVRS